MKAIWLNLHCPECGVVLVKKTEDNTDQAVYFCDDETCKMRYVKFVGESSGYVGLTGILFNE